MAEIEQEENVRTRLPTETDVEQPFFSIAELKLSLRQILTIALALMVWFMMLRLTVFLGGLFAFTISPFLAGVLWSWIVVLGIFFAMYKKNGMPYEEYLAQRIVFLISDRHFIFKDDEIEETQDASEIDWDDFDDPYDIMRGGKR
jgi:hypothetical protein